MKGNALPNQRIGAAWSALALSLALLWAYWPTLDGMVRRWSQDPQYTHGYITPLFAAIVLWFRKDSYPADDVRPSWSGLWFLLLGGVLRLLGMFLSFEWLEAGSIIPCLVGGVLLVGGPAVLRWCWPAGVFLLFVLPWPWQLDNLLTFPLRRFATITSTYALQTLGVPALARGNIIVVNDLEVGVAEACSGLGMLMTFFALSTAVAFVVERPTFDRVVIFLSAVPIGVMMNVVRITITVFLFRFANADLAKIVFHDVAGWVMMPMALAVLWLELCWLAKLWQPIATTGPVPVRSNPDLYLPTPVVHSREGRAARVPAARPSERLSRPEEADQALLEIPDAAP